MEQHSSCSQPINGRTVGAVVTILECGYLSVMFRASKWVMVDDTGGYFNKSLIY